MKSLTIVMQTFILVMCWLGVLQSALLSTYFLSASKQSRTQFFLGLALFMVGLRALKSTLFLFQPDVPQWFLNIGFAAHAAIGPSLLLYIKSFEESFQFSAKHWLHFIPAIGIAAGLLSLDLNSFWYNGGYGVLLYYTLVYIVWYGYLAYKLFIRNKITTQISSTWILIMLSCLTIFQLAYFSNYILRLTSYSTAPVIYSAMIYVISFIVIKNNAAFQSERKKKYQNIKLTTAAIDDYQTRIINVMRNEKPYRDSKFSLHKLSSLTGIPAYVISNVLSEGIKQNFNTFTNGYRVVDAKSMLADSANDHYSITGIAYECGFSSVSSFNAAFKKIVNRTPSEFKSRRNSPEARSPKVRKVV